jgi:hypothetical protein
MSQKRTALAIPASFILSVGVLFGYQNCAQNGFEVADFASSSSMGLGHRLTDGATAMNHIQYFGYYGSAFETVGLGDYSKVTSDHANLTWIVVGNVPKKLEEAQDLGMKAMVDIQWVFMDANYHLRPDMATSWKNFAKTILPYRDTIAAFYPMDEPYGNGENKGVSDAEIKNNIEAIASITKSTFPEIPVAVIFSPKEVKASKAIPVGFDWIGFDCYGKFNDCYKGHSVTYYYNNLKSRISGSQRLMLVPWAYKAGYPSNGDINDRNNAAAQYWNLAISEPLVVAVVPFLYQTYTDSTGAHVAGAQDMPALLQTLKQMGLQVKKSQAGGITRGPVTGVAHAIAGNIDGVASSGTNQWIINGWACAQGLNSSINVDLYVGGAAGAGGTSVSRTLANKSSEDAVAGACRATGTAYRFQIPISSSLATSQGGKKIYVHGISPVGGVNSAIAASGNFAIPKVSSPTTTLPSSSGGSSSGGVSPTDKGAPAPAPVCLRQNVSPTYCEVNYYCGSRKISTTKTNIYDGTYVDYNNTPYGVGAILTTFTIPGYDMVRAYYQFRCTAGGWVGNDPSNPNNWCTVNKALPSSDSRCGSTPIAPPVSSGGGGGGGGCFVAGTPILMADGSQKSIEQIQVGDQVMGYDEESKQQIAQSVTQLHHHQANDQSLHEFHMSDGSVFVPNAIHPIFVVEQNAYFQTAEIESMWRSGIKISLQRADGVAVEVKDIVVKKDFVPVYNFEVEGLKNISNEYGAFGIGHNYYAHGFLVHNAVYGHALGKVVELGILGVPSFARLKAKD